MDIPLRYQDNPNHTMKVRYTSAKQCRPWNIIMVSSCDTNCRGCKKPPDDQGSRMGIGAYAEQRYGMQVEIRMRSGHEVDARI